MKLAMLEVARVLENEDLEAKMLLQVHDELVFEVSDGEIDELSKIIKEEMEDVIDLDVPLIVDVKAGQNWRDMKEVE
jgi:DNA polymerase-1